MLDMSNSGFPDWRQTPPLPSNGSPDVGGTSQSHHQPQADIDEAYAEALEQTQIPKRARGGPSPQIPTAKRTLSSTARGADGQANGGSNAHRMSLLDDDMLLSILGWEMADDAEDGSAHGSFAVAAAMQRASSSAAQDMSGGVSLDPSGLASMARTGFDIGADDSVTGGYHAAAALTATAQQLPLQRLGTLESTVGRPAAGLETGLAGGDETAIRGRNQYQQQQQQQPPLQPPLQQSRQQLLLQQHHHMRYANEQESQTNTQHQMQIPPQQEQQQQQLQLSNSQELQPSGTLAPSEVLASVGTGWPSRSGGIMLPSPAPAIAVSSFSQSPWALPLPSPPVQGGGTAGAPMQGLMPPTGAYDEDDIREDEGVDPKGDDVASRALQDDEDMPEGLLSEAASALLETSDRSGTGPIILPFAATYCWEQFQFFESCR